MSVLVITSNKLFRHKIVTVLATWHLVVLLQAKMTKEVVPEDYYLLLSWQVDSLCTNT